MGLKKLALVLGLSGCVGDGLSLPPVEACFDLVRQTVREEWANPGTRYLEEPTGQSGLGIFVRFVQGTQERGCLALTHGVEDWFSGVKFAAWDAGFRDPRYPHLKPEEAPTLEIEITFMGALAPLARPADFDSHREAIYMIHPLKSVILQPSVSRENHWSPEQTLEALCRKGHLPPGAWRDPGVIFFKAATRTFKEPFEKY